MAPLGCSGTIAAWRCPSLPLNLPRFRRNSGNETLCRAHEAARRRIQNGALGERIVVIDLRGLMLMLKLQYFGHLMQRVDSLEKTLMLGGIGGREKGTTEDEIAGWHH